MPIALSNKHDPWWEIDGPAARRARRQKRIVSTSAFAFALLAVTGSAYAWAFQLGFVGSLFVHLPFG